MGEPAAGRLTGPPGAGAGTREERCPQCGAPVAPADEPRFLDCGHCEARLYVDAVAHSDEWVAPAVSRSDAAARLLRELKDRECDGRPRLGSGRLMFVPFWQRAATPGLRLAPAHPDLADETRGWHVGGADRQPLDEDALARHGAALDATLQPPETGMSLLYLPFWELRYEVGDTAYAARVEAVSGAVVAAHYPPTRETRLSAAYGALLVVLGAVLTAGFRLVWQGGLAALAGLLVLALAGTTGVRAGRALMRGFEERQ